MKQLSDDEIQEIIADFQAAIESHKEAVYKAAEEIIKLKRELDVSKKRHSDLMVICDDFNLAYIAEQEKNDRLREALAEAYSQVPTGRLPSVEEIWNCLVQAQNEWDEAWSENSTPSENLDIFQTRAIHTLLTDRFGKPASVDLNGLTVRIRKTPMTSRKVIELKELIEILTAQGFTIKTDKEGM